MDTKDDNATSARSLAPRIAKHLEGWAVAPVREGDHMDAHCVTLAHTSGARLTLRTNQVGERDRLRIWAWGPSNDYSIHMEGNFEASVSASRNPETIAKEIARRVLPGYLPAHAAVLARVAAYEASDKAGQRVAERLRKHSGSTRAATQTGKGNDWCFYTGQGHRAKVSTAFDLTSSVAIDIGRVSVDCALAILDVLAKHAKEEA